MKLLRALLIVSCVGASMVGCSGDPTALSNEHLQKGQAYVKQGKLAEAEVEFRTALQYNPRMGGAYFGLGEIAHAREDGPAALHAFVRASDLLPDSAEAHVRAANYLIAGRRFEDARVAALKAVQLEPRNVEALILVGNASAGLNKLEDAITELQAAQKLDAGDSRIYTNLGWFEALRGRSDRAEAVFRSAVAAAPKSSAPHLALANYLLSTGKRDEAEKSLRVAVSLEPTHVPSLRALGFLLIIGNRGKEAEPFLVDAAKNDPSADSRLLLADYYVWSGRDPDAIRVLEQLKATRESVAADTRLAAILYRTDRARAKTLVAAVLKSHPRDLDAQLLSIQLDLDAGKLTEAMAATETVIAANPQVAHAFYLQGRILQELGRDVEAGTAFGKAISLNARAVPARLHLARLHIIANKLEEARKIANDVLRLAPGNPAARLLLVQVAHASHEWATANAQMSELVRAFPDWLPVQIEASRLAVAQSDWAAAAKALDRVDALRPDSAEAFEGRLAMDVGRKDFKSASTRLQARLAKNPNDQKTLLVAGQVYLASGDTARAEATWKKLLTVNPGNNDAYAELGKMYVNLGRIEAAEQQFAALAEKGVEVESGLILAGVLAHAQGKRDVAKQRYEKVLAANPQSGVAANNLAWLYAEEGANLDVALGLAQTAVRAAPDNPEFADTLGVIFLKKGQAASALPYLQAAVNKAPKNATIQLHLAQAFVAAGKADEARVAAEKALAIDPAFPEAAEAKAIVQRRGKAATPK